MLPEQLQAIREWNKPQARSKMPNLTERLLAVRRRAISEFWDGTSPTSGHWWVCLLCTWKWRAGDKEIHQPECPLAGWEP